MLAKNLRQMRKAKGYTLDMLAEAIGTSKQTISRYESGMITNIPPEKIEALAKTLSTTPAELMGWDSDEVQYRGITPLNIKKLPILGEIACGEPIYAEEQRESFVSIDKSIDADFCLKAHGNSMTGARIYDGDIVFIKAQDMVENGEIAAVIIGDEATLKRVYFYPNEGKLILSPENPHYAPLVYVKNELDAVKIIGKAVAFQSRII